MDYHIHEDHRIAADLNPLLDTIADLEPKHAVVFEQGCNTIITLVNDALTEQYETLLAQYVSLGIAADKGADDIHTVFAPVVDLIEERVLHVQAAIQHARQNATDGLTDLIAGLLGAMLGEDAAAEFRAEAEAEQAQAEYEAEVEAGIAEAEDFEDWLASLFPGRAA